MILISLTSRVVQFKGSTSWIVQSYTAFVATAIRRIVETPSKRWKSISLRILLEDMAKNDIELTRERFLRLYYTKSGKFADSCSTDCVDWAR